MRHLKIIAALFIGLLGLLAFFNNLFNIASAQSFVSAVLSAPEQPWYKVFGPTLGAAWHGWLGLAVIMAGELAAGLLGFAGAARMWHHRAAPADAFQRARTLAVAGGAIGMFVWYGFFVVIGELYFNMWQTELGLGSVGGAFRYGTVSAALTLFIALREE